MKSPLKVLSIGTAVLDVVAGPVPLDIFQKDATRVDNIQILPGGDALNVAITLSKLGIPCAVASKSGDDGKARLLFDIMHQHGIDTSLMKKDAQLSTSSSLVLFQQNGQRNFITMKGAHHYLTAKDLDFSQVKTFPFVNISSYFGLTSLDKNEVLTILSFCQTHGIVTTMDFMLAKTEDRLTEVPFIMPYLDYALPSEQEARQMTGNTNPEEMANTLFEMGCPHVIIKLGDQGCYLKTKTIAEAIPGYKVEVADSTGAGDSFVGAFIYGLSQQWDIQPCCHFANAVGAMNCRKVGATAGVERLEIILQFMEHQV